MPDSAVPRSVQIGQQTWISLGDVAQVARYRVPIEFANEEELNQRLEQSYNYIQSAVAEGEKQTIYGVNTGFGAMSGVRMKSIKEMQTLQSNLLWFLKAGAGGTLPQTDVRAAMLLRLRSFLHGASGIRWQLVKRLQFFLNNGITPVVREFGSIGASGDLVPLANIAGALIGADDQFLVDVESNGLQRMSARAALLSVGLNPIELQPKEGLALVNGTSVSTAIAANVIFEGQILFAVALGAHALMIQALNGFVDSFEPFIHRAKKHPGQKWIADQIRRMLAGSKLVARGPTRKTQSTQQNAALAKLMFRLTTGSGELDEAVQFHALLNKLRKILRSEQVEEQAESVLKLMRELAAEIDEMRVSTGYEQWDAEPIQDRYSIRCLPQFLGPVVDAFSLVARQVETEMNSANDNPLIDIERERIYHGGNFLAQYTAVAMDQIRYNLGLVAKHMDSQIALLVDPQFSAGLSPSLVGNHSKDTNTGLKGLQISGNSIVPIIEFLANSMTLRFPTHAEQFNQNISSQAFASANLARQSINTFRQYLAIALMFGVQGVDLRSRIVGRSYDANRFLSPATRGLYSAIRDVVGVPVSTSRPYIYNDDEQSLEDHIHAIASDLECCERGKIAPALWGTVLELRSYDSK